MPPTEPRSSLATPAAPYTSRPPSPPSIVIPAPSLARSLQPIKVVPSFANVDPSSLSAADLQIITQNGKEQIATDSAFKWTYRSRREAQPILDFLYLGPSSVIKDRQWIKDNGITMLLAARTAWMAEVQLLSIDKVAQELGIQGEYVDVSGHQELIRAFPSAVRKINDHMLRVFREQAVSSSSGGGSYLAPSPGDAQGSNSMAIDHENFRRGKVLVFCESGNDRSAAVVIAYLMSVYGLDLVSACQFVQYKRFSVSLDDDLKQLLRTYEGIVQAQCTVNTFRLNTPLLTAMDATDGADANGGSSTSTRQNGTHKRAIEDTMDLDDEDGADHMNDEFALDIERYQGRQHFVPFVDSAERGL